MIAKIILSAFFLLTIVQVYFDKEETLLVKIFYGVIIIGIVIGILAPDKYKIPTNTSPDTNTKVINYLPNQRYYYKYHHRPMRLNKFKYRPIRRGR
ncbi:hypothetical protein KKF34_07880 [Myxococcota bacterium]|nr:hypothetical protein [Myxococcota bacterium]MBU1381990.1 hypothetical protein [Myxococcota bacterium]MBU1496779.1 hypothetical protein [Myxococcota bacterium]